MFQANTAVSLKIASARVTDTNCKDRNVRSEARTTREKETKARFTRRQKNDIGRYHIHIGSKSQNVNELRRDPFCCRCMFFFNIGKLAAYLPIPFLMKGATYKLADLTLPVVQVIVAILAAVVFGVGKKAYKRPPIAGRHTRFNCRCLCKDGCL